VAHAAPAGYAYYQTCNVGSSSDGALTNFPEMFWVYNTVGTSSGNVIYTNGVMSSFPYDIQFTNSAGSTNLSEFCSWNNSTCAIYWVNIPSIPSSGGTNINVYYDQAGVSSLSNGTSTFTFYDQFGAFNSSNWTAYNTPTESISGSGITIGASSGSNNGYESVANYNIGTGVMAKVEGYNSTSGCYVGLSDTTTNNATLVDLDKSGNGLYIPFSLKNGAEATGTDFPAGANKESFNVYNMEWVNSTSCRFAMNGTANTQTTTDIPACSNMKIWLQDTNSTGNFTVAWVAEYTTTSHVPVPGSWTAQASTQMLQNPSFETGISPWQFTDANGTTGTVAQSSAWHTQGSYSALVNSGSNASSNWEMLYQSGLTWNAGDTLTFSYDTDVGSACTLFTEIADYNNGVFTSYVDNATPLTAGVHLQQTTTVTAPEATSGSGYVYIIMGDNPANTNMYVDNASLIDVPSSSGTPTPTPTPSPTATPVPGSKTSWSEMPVRGYFEQYAVTDITDQESLMNTAHSEGYNVVFCQNAGTNTEEDIAINSPAWNSSLSTLVQYAQSMGMSFVPFVDTDMPAPSGALANGYQNDVAAAPCVNVSYLVNGADTSATVQTNPAVTILDGSFTSGTSGWTTIGGGATISSNVPSGYSDSAQFYGSGVNELGQMIAVAPYHEYDLSYWVSLSGTNGQWLYPRLESQYSNGSYNGYNLLDYDLQGYGTGTVSFGWTQINCVFNSLNNTNIDLVLGSTSSGGGYEYITGLSMSDVGILNIVRNTGTPVKVVAASGGALGTVYTEGTDYSYLSDPSLGTDTMYHTVPTITIPSGSRITAGESLNVSCYDAVVDFQSDPITSNDYTQAMDIGDPNINGTTGLWNTNMKNLQQVANPPAIAVDYDEMRAGGYASDEPANYGTLIGTTFQQIQNYWSAINSSAPLYVWNDMFDPYQNGIPYYYSTRNGTSGAGSYLNSNVTVLNWNEGVTSSYNYFGSLGVPQVIAGYYDANQNPAPWIASAKAAGDNIQGALYTTWSQNFGWMNTFASDVWTNTIPVASFRASLVVGSAPFQVQFTDTSAGPGLGTPSLWQWNFGDGSGNSTLENPGHTYTTPGTYTVTMTATNQYGSTTVVATNAIVVTASGSAPTAAFTTSTVSGTVPFSVQFTDTSSGGPTSWYWNFGDGAYSTSQNVQHTYNAPGTFTVVENVSNAWGYSLATTTITAAAPGSTPTPTPTPTTGSGYTPWDTYNNSVLPSTSSDTALLNIVALTVGNASNAGNLTGTSMTFVGDVDSPWQTAQWGAWGVLSILAVIGMIYLVYTEDWRSTGIVIGITWFVWYSICPLSFLPKAEALAIFAIGSTLVGIFLKMYTSRQGG
jgi:PKD repeat protein